MSKLFDYKDVKNRPSRSGFDLSNKHSFTAKVGELLPVYWKLVYPGDKFNMKIQHMTRTQPVETAAFARIREYFDWFYVPMRLLWKSFPSAITLMDKNPVQARSIDGNVQVTDAMPHLYLSDLVGYNGVGFRIYHERPGIDQEHPRQNYFGFNRVNGFLKLLSYLGYGKFFDSDVPTVTRIDKDKNKPEVYEQDRPVNIFPLLAYQKIYNDFFRNTQWEKANPFLWNVDYSTGGRLTVPVDDDPYWNNETMFDLRYSNFNKDLFFGVLPESQYGDVAEVDLGSVTVPYPVYESMPGTYLRDMERSVQVVSTNGHKYGMTAQGTEPQPLEVHADANDGEQFNASKMFVDLSKIQVPAGISSRAVGAGVGYKFNQTFSVLALRQAEFLQRWKEIAQAGSQDYKDQVYRHFGVKLSSSMSNLCHFIGGDSSNIDISEVVNQTLGSEDSDAVIKGKGVGVGESFADYNVDDYGIIMCIYHAVPLLDYDTSGIDLQLLKTSAYDYPIPEFDKVGFEELDTISFTNRRLSSDSLPITPHYLGYVPRYIDVKTSVDRVNGAFSTTLKHWLAPVTDDYISEHLKEDMSLTYNFFKVNPRIVDNIFGVDANSSVDTDQLLVNAYFDVKAVRNFDYNGLPY